MTTPDYSQDIETLIRCLRKRINEFRRLKCVVERSRAGIRRALEEVERHADAAHLSEVMALREEERALWSGGIWDRAGRKEP